jgi:hypothetical protein
MVCTVDRDLHSKWREHHPDGADCNGSSYFRKEHELGSTVEFTRRRTR